MEIYFVTAGNNDEKKVIKTLQPKNILLSYFYFHKRKKIVDFIEYIGYKPNILFDSGAYSALTKGKHIALTKYMEFIREISDLISEYVQLDYIGNPFITQKYFEIMRNENLKPIPVFHYGDNESFLEFFINSGEKRIALGGTVMVNSKSEVSDWARVFCWLYPDVKFHLLGSSSTKILNTCDLWSVDSSTWIMMSVNGYPNNIRLKEERMFYNMQELIDFENKHKKNL